MYIHVYVCMYIHTHIGARVRHCLSQARSAATRAAASKASREEHGGGGGGGVGGGGGGGGGGSGDSGRALFDTEQWVRGLERLLGNLWDLHAGGGGGGGGVHADGRTQAFHVVSAA